MRYLVIDIFIGNLILYIFCIKQFIVSSIVCQSYLNDRKIFFYFFSRKIMSLQDM